MLTPIKAIRAKCLDCCCGQYKEVELCPSADCPLYPYRFGKNPNIRLTDEQRAAKAVLLKKNTAQLREKSQAALSEGTYTHHGDAKKEANPFGR